MQTEWQLTHSIQMSLQSAELKLDQFASGRSLVLSCNLVSIARGRCMLCAKPGKITGSKGRGKLVIPVDRPLMTGDIMLNRQQFDALIDAFSVGVPKQASITLVLREALAVSLAGDLRIEQEETLSITDFQVSIPLQ